MRRRFFKGAIRNDCVIFEVLNGYISFGLSRNPIEYSLDDGISWVKLNAGELTPTYTDIPRVLIKCTPTYIGLNDGIGNFTVYGEFNLSGNVMALLGGYHHLKKNIFYNLFKETSVVNVSKTFLPATTLAEHCYESMFEGCTSLVNAPELPATTLAPFCYNTMFYRCSKLNYIKMLATDISAPFCLSSWVSGVASSGTFVKNPAMNSLPTGYSGIPSGWTVVNDGEESGEDNKVVNKVHLVEGKFEWLLMFDYPVNSHLKVNFADGSVDVIKGNQQWGTGYPSFDKPTIVGIDPLEDDKYIYTW